MLPQGTLQALLGIGVFILICGILSENRKAISFKQITLGLCLQVALAACILHLPFVRTGFYYIAQGVMAIKEATLKGTSFVFGFLGGGALPFDVKGNTFVFALQALPMIIVISALSMLLFHWRILPLFVQGVSWIMRKTLGIGGALGVGAAAKVFLGQTDAPLLIRPYLKSMSRSEIFSIMSMGFATTSATIMGVYAMIIEKMVPEPMVHILTASIISVPAALTLSRIVVPNPVLTEGKMVLPHHFSSSMDAISKGTADGAKLFGSIIAMLIVFIALVALGNKILEALPYFEGQPITLQRILGVIMAPLTWLMGIPWKEALSAGGLLGVKSVLNECYAFTELAQINPETLSVHTRIIMTYALCGFANVGSIGIMIGGLGTLVPEKREEVISLSFKALVVGTLSSCLSGTIVGILLNFQG